MKAQAKRLADRRVLALACAGLLLAEAMLLVATEGHRSLAAAGAFVPSGSVIYVDWEASGANNGESWIDAYTGLQFALAAALPGDQIWVAAGTHYPSAEHGGSGDRYRSFQMLNGVGLYGGFDPTTGDVGWQDRDWVSNVSTLSGDIGMPGYSEDNCYHVFYHPAGTDLNWSAILDGFTISGGYADGEGDHGAGGGMLNAGSSPTLTNCTFAGNSAGSAGGMYNSFSSPRLTNCTFTSNSASDHSGGGMRNDSSSLTLTNCTFTGNSASGRLGGQGGGIYNASSSLTLTNCTFTGNVAYDYHAHPEHYAGYGGGMYNDSSSLTLTNCAFESNTAKGWLIVPGAGGGMCSISSSPTLTNCTFKGNLANGDGGGMSNFSSSPALTNCTFMGNSANGSGGGIKSDYFSSPALTNCILWGDTPNEIDAAATVTYSDIQGGYAGVGNIDADPLFREPAGGDYHLTPGSPCIDAGTNDAPYLPLFDWDGDDRIADGGDGDGSAVADMGADEFALLAATNDSPTRLGSATTLTATVASGIITYTWTYAWAFGDGGFGSGAVVTHIYPDVGRYAAVVTATNVLSLAQDVTTVTVYLPHTLCLPLVFHHH